MLRLKLRLIPYWLAEVGFALIFGMRLFCISGLKFGTFKLIAPYLVLECQLDMMLRSMCFWRRGMFYGRYAACFECH